jgi:hypothetical protein
MKPLPKCGSKILSILSTERTPARRSVARSPAPIGRRGVMFKRRIEWFLAGAILTIFVILAYAFWMAGAQ